MQTENKLNITAGEWMLENFGRNDFSKLLVSNGRNIGVLDFAWCSNAEANANTALIADAGTTANLCGLLPSELLKQRDELRGALEIASFYVSSVSDKPDWEIVQAALVKTKIQ